MKNRCKERVMTFKAGLHIFWEREVLELILMIGDFLKFIAYVLFGFWIVLTFCWLLFSPLKNTPHWVDYLGVGSLLLQAITAGVLFIRHVHHLGSAPTGNRHTRHTRGSQKGDTR